MISAPGKEIMDGFAAHAVESGSEILQELVTDVQKTQSGFSMKTTSGKELTSDYMVLATGNKYRHLGVK